MILFLFLLSILLFSTAGGTDGDSFMTDHYPEVKIIPLISTEILFKRVDDTLNVTCTVVGENAKKFHLEWLTPIDTRDRYGITYKLFSTNSLNLYVDALQEIDGGNYSCVASLPSSNLRFLKNFYLKINNRQGHCGKNHFSCNSDTCIHQRYVCDGRLDCSDGEDESERNCGTSPCQGKLTCDGRCIPVSWCCQQFVDANCTATVRLACCSEIHKPYIDNDNGISSADQQRLNDIHFLQTTIYIVIGSAVAFMLVVTILVVTICRTHMKRTVLSARYPATDRRNRANNVNNNLRYPYHLRNSLSLHQRLETEMYDLDLYLNRSSGLNCLVTYNINNGVQFVGHPVEPPPYSEVISLPPREGPPPPYVSRENVCRQGGQAESEALLENASALTTDQDRNVDSCDETYFWPRITIRRCSSSDDTLSEENQTVRPSDSSDSSDNPMPNPD